MNWLGPAKQIEVSELGDVLLIKATSTKGAIGLVVPIFACVWTYLVWRDKHWALFFFGLFFLGSSIWILFRDKNGELRVSDTDIAANGDLGRWADGSVQFRWEDISGLEFRQGGEDEPTGLYARTGRWSATCVMAGLNREQSEEVISAIFQRFPYVVMAEDRDGWSLFGNGSELTTLGLYKPKK
jgi:hypothetical protein